MKRIPTLLWIFVAVFCFAALLNAAFPRVPSGTWAPAENLATAREGASAVLLPDGRILITGGTDAAGQPLASAELFNTDGSFTAAAPLNAARSGHLAVMLYDGDVLVAGGTTTGGGVTNSAELYDLNADHWTTLSATMLDARTGATAAQLLDGDVLIAGGQDANGVPLASLERFVLTQGTFTHAGVLVAARKDAAAAVLNDGRVLITGGTTADANGTSTLASTEIYDPVAGSVAAGPTLVTARAGHSATTLLDGTVLIAGGNNPDAAQNGAAAELASAEIYDPAAGTVTATASLATARTEHQAFLLPNNNNVLIVGGSAAGSALASAELYTPWTGQFQTTAAMAAARASAAGAALYNPNTKSGTDGLLLVAGGKNDTGTLASGELYGFATVKTDQADYAPGTVVTITGSGWQPGETVTLTLVESPLIDTPPTMTVVADGNGNLFNDQFSPDIYDLDIRFYLTAVGSQSGFQAQNTFTDANRQFNISSLLITSPAGATDNTMNISQAFNVHIVFNVTGGTWTGVGATLSVPSGWSKSADLSGLSISNTANRTFDWTVTPSTSPTTTGTISVSVNGTVANPDNCNQCPATRNFTVNSVNPAALTTTSMTAAKTGGGGTTVKAGDSVTVTMVVANGAAPRATANAVAPSVLTVNHTGTAAATCGAGTPASANIAAAGSATYTYTCTGVSGDGTLTFVGSANGTDENTAAAVSTGNTTTNSITVDSTVPVAPSTPDMTAGTDSGSSNTDNITNVKKPTFTGTEVEDGTTVTLLVDGVANGTAVTSGGTWTITAANDIADGPHSVTATATDSAGNISGASGALSITIDTIANAPSTPDLDAASDSGSSNTDNITNVTTPKFNGTAEKNASVELFRGGATSLGTTTADGSGNWSLTLASPLLDGTYSITAKQTDVAGNVSAASGALSITIDTTAPSVTSPNLSPSDDTGASNSDNITNKTANLSFTGSTDPSAKVELFEGATSLGTTTSNAGSGNWSIAAAGPFVEGNHNFTAKATDAAGNTGTSAPHTVMIDITRPNVSITPPSGNVSVPFTFNWSLTDPTAGGVSSGVNASSCTLKIDAAAPVAAPCTSSNSSLVSGTHTVVVAGADIAGNANSATRTYTLDSIPPVVIVTFPAIVHGQNGWYNAQDTVPVVGTVTANDSTTGGSNVTAITCTGATVGAITGLNTVSASAPVSVSAEGINNVSCTATDSAGNIGAGGASSNTATVKIDTQAPTGVAGAADRAADHNSWYNHSLAVTFSGTDSTSGIASCTTPNYSGPDSATASVLGHCTDNAGNTSSDVAFSFKFDSTAPTAVALSVTAGTAGANGWYTSDVTVHTSGAETVSTPLSCTADQPQTTETVGQAFNGSCTNDAGLTSNAAPLTVKLDKTGPTATLAVSAGTLGDNGWYVSDVTVHASGADSISTPVTCTADQFLTTDSTGHAFSGSCTNDAGLSTNATDLIVKLDKTPPTVHITPDHGADHGGWYNHSLSFTNPGSDSTSGIASCSTPAAYSGPDSAAASVSASCKDNAGNTGNGSFTFQYDATPPANVAGAPNRAADHNGWFSHAVDVVFSGNDATSGIDSCSTVSYSGPDTANTSVNGTCTDNAGNSSAPVASSSFKFDSTPPTAGLAVSAGTPGANGWYTSNVTVSTSGTDTVSNPTVCTTDQFQTAETTGTAFAGECTNDAGLSTDAAPLSVKLDKTAPTAVTLTPAGTLGKDNWYVSNVTIHTSGDENISTPIVCTLDQSQTTDTTGQVFHGSCTNNAGLSANASDITTKRDATPPVVHITPSRAADHNSWYNHSLSFTNPGTDATSGIAACATPAAYSGPDSSAASVSASCEDNAGNTANDSFSFQYDATPPTNVSGAPNRVPDHNGWYNQMVDVAFHGQDATSGIDTCSTINYATPDSATASVMGHCTDQAGNSSADVASSSFKFDATPPTAALAVTAGTPGTHGWYTSDVTVSASGNDTISNPTTCTAPQFQTAETTGTEFTGSCTNDAGLSANATPLTVKLDKTAPTGVTLTPVGTLGSHGWYISDVTIKTAGSENISNPIVCTADQSQTTDTTGQMFHGSCTNDAGLSATASDITIKRDATPPVLSGSRTPVPNAYGWNNVDVTANFSCSDATSGVDVGPVTPQVVSTEGAAQSRSADCSDLAGNISHATVDNINIDKTPPTISASILPLSPAGTGWYNISTGRPTASFSCGDSLSGVVSCPSPVGPMADGADQTVSGNVMDKAGNSASASIVHINVDLTPPSITLTTPDGSSYVLNQLVSASYGCTDGTSGVASCAGPVLNGKAIDTGASDNNPSAPGFNKNFTVNATDVAGNSASKTNSYATFYSTGACLGSPGHDILQPIDANRFGTIENGSSVWKQGSTVPAKFRVCDANGNSIGTAGVVSGFGLYKINGGTLAQVDELTIDNSTNDLGWRFDGSQWIFNMSTKTSPINKANQTYYFQIQLNDGTYIYFNYGLK